MFVLVLASPGLILSSIRHDLKPFFPFFTKIMLVILVLDKANYSIFRKYQKKKKEDEEKSLGKKGLFRNGSIQLIDTTGTAKEQRPVAWNWE